MIHRPYENYMKFEGNVIHCIYVYSVLIEAVLDAGEVDKPSSGPHRDCHGCSIHLPPVLIMVVMDAGEVGDGGALGALKVQLPVVLVGPHHVAPGGQWRNYGHDQNIQYKKIKLHTKSDNLIVATPFDYLLI